MNQRFNTKNYEPKYYFLLLLRLRLRLRLGLERVKTSSDLD